MYANSDKAKKSLRYSFFDGIFASGMVGFTQDYFTPFLLLLGATSKQVGILSSLPNLAAALIQLKSPDLTAAFRSRKKIITMFVLFQSAVLVPMVFMAANEIMSPWLFIFLATFFMAAGACALPPWGSLMSDLVSEKKRGDYFGWRNKTLGFIMVVFSFVGGCILHVLESMNIFTGFLVLFSCAGLFRVFSWYFLTKMEEPPLTHKKEDYFNILMFLKRTKESNFTKFVLFVAMLNFCVNIASPFFAVFMLRDLKFNYLTYTWITVTATMMVYLLMRRWGRHADRVGNLKIMKFTAPIISILPLLWLINLNPFYLFLAQIVSGFAWAGFNLCASNFIYDAVSPEKRTRCIAYFNVLNGFALCLGALLGGFLSDKLPPILGYKLLTLFLLASVLRLIVVIRMPVYLKEVRPVEKVSSEALFFSVVGIRPLPGLEHKTSV